ncbi:hypothetical protein GMLC_14420 [Geomonas limicola]|uniref:Rubrerythrin diiron-binding domain-containing protein n=1 Tax=Geomonas limicola TaxID=2740186 RepID=A0A6V8N8M3_9BACT|nr:ferritin family protein [Geomonas limicola]GFO67863.1 hypothetical protein GMLC_14420 [Geomonas limicola]
MTQYDDAIKTELQGKACYENLASQTRVTRLKGLFLGLAAEEDRHIEAFRALKARRDYRMPESQLLDQAKAIFRELLANREEWGELREDLEGYRFVMKIEAESVRTYEELGRREEHPGRAELYRRIIEEEKNHFNIMENVFEFVLRPRSNLAWRELQAR